MIIAMEKDNKYYNAFVWAFEELGKNQTEFADIFKYKQPAISLLLKGDRTVKLWYLKKIAAHMGITHHELMSQSNKWSHISSISHSEPEEEPDMIKSIFSTIKDIQEIDPDRLTDVLKYVETMKVMAKIDSPKKRISGED